MVTEKEANIAREKHSNYLRSCGVHAVAVDKVRHKGKETFGVVAYVEKEATELPETLNVKVGKKNLKVPLEVRIAEKFKQE